MTRLQQLHDEQDQSPWLDDLTRTYLRDGTLETYVRDGIRGVTTNPTILARAIEGSPAYDEQLGRLASAGTDATTAYWDLVIEDVREALAQLRATYDASGGADGFVSIEVAPELARDTRGTITAARQLHLRIDQPNLLVKIPATAECIPAIHAMTAEGRSINVTLIFSLSRYRQVIDAYQSGLDEFARSGGDTRTVHSVASFFVSRVDSEADQRLESIGTPQAMALRGRAALAQARLAYQLFRAQFSTTRWEALAGGGAHPQRPLWASTSTKNPSYADTRYVDGLIGPATVNTLPEPLIAAFEDHGSVSRTVDLELEHAAAVLADLDRVGVDMESVGMTLEDHGVASFHESFAHVLDTLTTKLRLLERR